MTRDVGVRNVDPDTSHAAADMIEPHVNRIEGIVYDFLAQTGLYGATCAEISHYTGIPLETVTPRMCPLERKKMIERTGTTRRFPGKKAKRIVWIIC